MYDDFEFWFNLEPREYSIMFQYEKGLEITGKLLFKWT